MALTGQQVRDIAIASRRSISQNGRPLSPTEEEKTMKEFHCGSLVPGCDWHTRHEEEAEVMRRAIEHMRETHGEDTIRETMVEAIRSRIETARNAA